MRLPRTSETQGEDEARYGMNLHVSCDTQEVLTIEEAAVEVRTTPEAVRWVINAGMVAPVDIAGREIARADLPRLEEAVRSIGGPLGFPPHVKARPDARTRYFKLRKRSRVA